MTRTFTVVDEEGILRSGGGCAILGFVLGIFFWLGERDMAEWGTYQEMFACIVHALRGTETVTSRSLVRTSVT